MSTNTREDQRILRRMAKDSGLAEHGIEIVPGGWTRTTKSGRGVYLYAEPQGHGMSRNVKVYFQGRIGRETTIPAAEVNWSSIGASSPERAHQFGLTLQAVAKAAEEWNRLRDHYMKEFEQAVEDIKEEGPPPECPMAAPVEGYTCEKFKGHAGPHHDPSEGGWTAEDVEEAPAEVK